MSLEGTDNVARRNALLFAHILPAENPTEFSSAEFTILQYIGKALQRAPTDFISVERMIAPA